MLILSGKCRVNCGSVLAISTSPLGSCHGQCLSGCQHPHWERAGDVLLGVKGAFRQGGVKNFDAKGEFLRPKARHDSLRKRASYLDAGLHMLWQVGLRKGARARYSS